MKDLLNKVLAGESLNREEAKTALGALKNEEFTPEQGAALLAGMRVRGETAEEISGFALGLLEDVISVEPKRNDLVDTCGTGGDGAQTFNISTTVAFIVAASGVGVAKHGNRSVSSLCGSADVLDELGVPTSLGAEEAATAIDQNGFAFLFAPNFHPAVKKVMPIRKAMGVRTIFNLLGPLLNPAPVKRQVIGVFDANYCTRMAEALQSLGAEKAMIVSAEDGLDEISIASATFATFLDEGKIRTESLTPEDLGLKRGSVEELKGGDARINAAIIEGILKGETQGPKKDVVVANAAAGIWVAGKASSLKDAADLAAGLIQEGRALEVLEKSRR